MDEWTDGWICMYSKKRMFDILFQSIRVRRKRVLTFILYVKMNSNKKEKNYSNAVKLDVLEYNVILVYVGKFLLRVADAFQSDDGISLLLHFFPNSKGCSIIYLQ